MADKLARHYFIGGKVQGVWFRDSTRQEAQRLGVTGWVRNVPDGRVEALFCGDAEQLAAMHAWLQHGPELADVTELSFEEVALEVFAGFEVRR